MGPAGTDWGAGRAPSLDTRPQNLLELRQHGSHPEGLNMASMFYQTDPPPHMGPRLAGNAPWASGPKGHAEVAARERPPLPF